MNPLILGPIFELGKTLLERWIPDPEKKREAEMELIKMAAQGELQQVIAQLEINAREAAHPSIWVAGWRPAFGWVGAAAFGYSTIVQPALAWYGASRGWPEPPLPRRQRHQRQRPPASKRRPGPRSVSGRIEKAPASLRCRGSFVGSKGLSRDRSWARIPTRPCAPPCGSAWRASSAASPAWAGQGSARMTAHPP